MQLGAGLAHYGTARRERTRSVCRDYLLAVSINRFEPNGQTDWVSDRHKAEARRVAGLFVDSAPFLAVASATGRSAASSMRHRRHRARRGHLRVRVHRRTVVDIRLRDMRHRGARGRRSGNARRFMRSGRGRLHASVHHWLHARIGPDSAVLMRYAGRLIRRARLDRGGRTSPRLSCAADLGSALLARQALWHARAWCSFLGDRSVARCRATDASCRTIDRHPRREALM